jgi:hypothetical protein
MRSMSETKMMESKIPSSDDLLETMQEHGGYATALCSDCEHLHCWQEGHPYGMTTAYEELCECGVDETRDCPALQLYVAKLVEELT